VARVILENIYKAGSILTNMKKSGVLLIFLLIGIIITLNIARAEDIGLPPDIEKINSGAEKVNNAVTNINDLNGTSFVLAKWKEMFLRNPTVKAIDSAFKKMNIVFRVLFGQNYSFSLKLLIVICLWLFFFLAIGKIIAGYSTFSPGIAYIIGAIFSVILAQAQALSKQADFFIWLAFANKSWWVSLLIWFVIIAVFITLLNMVGMLGKAAKERRKKMKQELEDFDNRLKMKTGAKAGESLSEAVIGSK